MAKQLPIIETETDTFYSWIIKTNEVVNFCNTEVVTANNSANGAVSTGKGFVIGTLGANTIAASTVRGGNTIANGVMTITGDVNITDGKATFNSGSYHGNSAFSDAKTNLIVNSKDNAKVIDSFSKNTYRSAKYVISARPQPDDNNNYQATEILLLHNGSDVYTTEYATLVTNTHVAVFTASISGNNVNIEANSSFSNVSYTVTRTLLNK